LVNFDLAKNEIHLQCCSNVAAMFHKAFLKAIPPLRLHAARRFSGD
jgi:hypothetical protein